MKETFQCILASRDILEDHKSNRYYTLQALIQAKSPSNLEDHWILKCICGISSFGIPYRRLRTYELEKVAQKSPWAEDITAIIMDLTANS
jgi:hypothetical protein